MATAASGRAHAHARGDEARWNGGSRRDAPGDPRLSGVRGQRLVGGERQVALEGQPQAAAHRRQFREAHVAEFRGPEPEIAQPDGEVGILRVEFRQQPRTAGVGREQLNSFTTGRTSSATSGWLCW
jgi:hypothetical protein